jgi:hypothetical protein
MMRTLAVLLLVAAASVLAWSGWLGWDHGYQTDDQGLPDGTYQAWQVIGSALTVVGVVVVGLMALRGGARLVVPLVAGLAYAVAWSASTEEADSGLWVIGVGFLVIGAAAVLALIAAAAIMVRDRSRD